MPAVMRNPCVIVATGAEMNNVLYALSLRCVRKSLLWRIMSMV
jgi:hypothetical protein